MPTIASFFFQLTDNRFNICYIFMLQNPHEVKHGTGYGDVMESEVLNLPLSASKLPPLFLSMFSALWISSSRFLLKLSPLPAKPSPSSPHACSPFQEALFSSISLAFPSLLCLWLLPLPLVPHFLHSLSSFPGSPAQTHVPINHLCIANIHFIGLA